MRKPILLVLGGGLLIFGAVALAKGGIPHTAHHEFDLVLAKGSLNTREVWVVHPAFAWLALAAGAFLIFLGARAKS